MKQALVAVIALVVIAAAVGVALVSRAPQPDLVVYCAHDATHSKVIIDRFSEETGLVVDVRFDTEATKSLGLVERLIRERAAPEADVFWNNELLGTLDLAERGILAPYQGPGWQATPPAYRDEAGLWTGFGARLRVWLVNTDQLGAEPDPATVKALWENQPERCALAKPLYGTTLTHFSLLWKRLGGDALQARHQQRIEAGLRVVDGNAVTARLAAEGVVAVAATDTDDAVAEIEAGKPVALLPLRIGDEGATIAIPNTIAITAGARHRAAAERFVDFVTSPAIAIALANGRARQVPVIAVDHQALPPEVARFAPWVAEGADLGHLGVARSATIAWLKERYAP